MKKNKNKKKNNNLLIHVVKDMFEKAGYDVEMDSFSDKSSSWLDITKNNNENMSMELSFNYEGTKLTNFNIWKDIISDVGNEKIF